jgi:heptosyltransferase-2
MAQSPASSPKRLLVRGVNWLGDAVMTTPALQRLRERFPQSHIAILTPEKLGELWVHHPSVDSVITFAAGENPWSVSRRLRAQKFDTALVFPNSPRSALEVRLARIPQRIGYARPWRNWFLTHPIPTRAGQIRMQKLSNNEINCRISALITDHASRFTSHDHHIYDYLHLAAALGATHEPIAPRLVVTDSEIEADAEKFKLPRPSSERPTLALNPGAEYGPAKRWPVDRFIAAALGIQKQTNCAWLILGGNGDVQIANEIHSAFRTPHSAFNLAGQTSLRELMVLLKLCRVLLTNDSGPMHVAAALGTPVIALFGSTSPELTGPGLPGANLNRLLRADARCSPCFRRKCPIDMRCMTGISVEQVVEAVLKTTGKA